MIGNNVKSVQPIPLVSVCLPVYNKGKYLRQCLESLINQTLKNIEIIAVNDASTDNCRDILHEFTSQYDCISVIENPQNYGALKSREIALRAAHGEYVNFMDADDWMDIQMYEKLYARAVSTASDAVVCGYFKMHFEVSTDGIEELIEQVRVDNVVFDSKDGRCDIVLGNSCHFLQVKLWKRHVLLSVAPRINFDAGVFFGDDLLMTAILYFYAGKVVALNEPLVFYRVLSDKPYRLQQEITDLGFVYGYLVAFFSTKEPCYLKSLSYRITGILKYWIIDWAYRTPYSTARENFWALYHLSTKLYSSFRHNPLLFWRLSCVMLVIRGIRWVYHVRMGSVMFPIFRILIVIYQRFYTFISTARKK